METGKVVLGVVAGAAIGALLGVLFAPEKGSETRKKISGKASDSVDDIRNKIADLISTSCKEEMSDFHRNGKYASADFKSGIKAGMR